MKNKKTILITIAVILLTVLLIGFRYSADKKHFNNGICPKCGTPFSLVAVDSHTNNDSNLTFYYYSCANNHDIECLFRQIKK